MGEKKGNSVTSGDEKRKFSYIRRQKREIQLHQETKKGNSITSGDKKGNSVTSGDKKGQFSYIRRKKELIQLYPG